MTYTAKTDDKNSTFKYFIEEMLSVVVFLLFLPIIFAIIGQGEAMLSIRAGYTHFLSSGLILPALLIGLFYSGLHIFGSRIYLDHRENTFCIPINRCASLLAAVTSSILLTVIFKKQFYSTTQLISAAVLIMAILVLYVPTMLNRYRATNLSDQQCYLFVCPGNTGRSPMAQWIFIYRIKKHLQAIGAEQKFKNIRIMSAAINGEEGRPMDKDAQFALRYLGIPVEERISTRLSADNIMQAKKIWCMSVEQKQLILDKFPESAEKLYSLDEYEHIPVPHGKGIEAYIDCARHLESAVELIVQKEIANI